MYRILAPLLAAIFIAATGNHAYSSKTLFKEVDLDQVETNLENRLREEVNYELSKSTETETSTPLGGVSGRLRPTGLNTDLFLKPKGTLYDIYRIEIDGSAIASGPWFKYDLTFFIKQQTPFVRTIRVQTTCSTRPIIPSDGLSVDSIKAECALPTAGRVHESLVDSVLTAANRLNTGLSASYIERLSQNSKSFLACSKKNALFSKHCELDETEATFTRTFSRYVNGTDISEALCDPKYEYVQEYLHPRISTTIEWSNSNECRPHRSSLVAMQLGNEYVLVSRGHSRREFDVAQYGVPVEDNLDSLCRNQGSNVVYSFPFSMAVFSTSEKNQTIHGSCDLKAQARFLFASKAAAEGLTVIEREIERLMPMIKNRQKDHLYLLQISSPALCNAVDRLKATRRVIAEIYENGVVENVPIEELGPYGFYFALYESEIKPVLEEAMENEEMPFFEEPWDYFLENYDAIVQTCGSEIDLEIDDGLDMTENEFFEALGHLPNYEKEQLWKNLQEYRALVKEKHELKIQYETIQALGDSTPRSLPLELRL